jgi:hypothetical protein
MGKYSRRGKEGHRLGIRYSHLGYRCVVLSRQRSSGHSPGRDSASHTKSYRPSVVEYSKLCAMYILLRTLVVTYGMMHKEKWLYTVH